MKLHIFKNKEEMVVEITKTGPLEKLVWASFIAPAGTSTLTCYLVPYLIYPVLVMLQVKLPDFLTTGVVGLVKSMAFAFFIIYLTGLLGKVNIKLKV